MKNEMSIITQCLFWPLGFVIYSLNVLSVFLKFASLCEVLLYE
jgi:hypothetical protein